jgi:hypothetical protein
MDDYRDMDEQELRKAAEKIRGAIMTLPLRYARTIKLLNDALKHMGMVGDISKKPKKEITLGKGSIVSLDQMAKDAMRGFFKKDKR